MPIATMRICLMKKAGDEKSHGTVHLRKEPAIGWETADSNPGNFSTTLWCSTNELPHLPAEPVHLPTELPHLPEELCYSVCTYIDELMSFWMRPSRKNPEG
jgi:hypothetical protein